MLVKMRRLRDAKKKDIVSFYYLRGEAKGRFAGVVTGVKDGLVTIFSPQLMGFRSFKPGYAKRVWRNRVKS